MYVNRRWQFRISGYMAIKCMLTFSVLPIVALAVWDGDEPVKLMLAFGLLGGTYLVGLIRIFRAGVYVRGNQVVIRNMFRTIRIDASDVRGVGTRSMWQNFVVIAAVELPRRRWVSAVGVPAEDAEVLAARLGVKVTGSLRGYLM